ncbi:hypothetical protein Premu_2457 [Hallella multisaccharivorax DSM 17128]|uniref:Uncharacterized protein n=1 Tax=Hallella multisaccharivorax DSM 17128 TaxID=688246 RepID=F8NAE6_9BACT|nr:hypothetical protein Premu_2457 [Hallella multisaccharivorax DSM 17128]
MGNHKDGKKFKKKMGKVFQLIYLFITFAGVKQIKAATSEQA